MLLAAGVAGAELALVPVRAGVLVARGHAHRLLVVAGPLAGLVPVLVPADHLADRRAVAAGLGARAPWARYPLVVAVRAVYRVLLVVQYLRGKL